MAPRFKGKPNFDFSLPCPSCGYKIQSNELVRLASQIIKCPKCEAVFDEMAGKKPLSTSWPMKALVFIALLVFLTPDGCDQSSMDTKAKADQASADQRSAGACSQVQTCHTNLLNRSSI
jgi:hypothetical protein